jgi:hypothetical protein
MAKQCSTPDSNLVVEETSPGHHVNERMVISMRRIKSVLITFAMLVVIALSSGVSNASAAGGWTVLGNDPLFTGGIYGQSVNPSLQTMRNNFVHDMLSARGHKAMRLAGLSGAEINAVDHAFQTGQFKKCALDVGDHFDRMSFGVGEVFVDRNVTYDDTAQNGAPAFCFSVTVNGTTISGKVPWKCGNFAISTEYKKPAQKKSASPPTCSTNQTLVNGSCVNQTQTVTCGPGTTQSGQNCVPIQANCSNTNVGSGSPEQGGNCNNVCNGTDVCNQTTPTCPTGEIGTPPDACFGPPSVINITNNQEYWPGETGLSLCATTTGTVTSVQFVVRYGTFLDGGNVTTQTSANKWCDNTYSAPDDVPGGGSQGNDPVTAVATGPGGSSQPVTVQLVIKTNPPSFQ